jgi:tetratricopeptide (TPR) repeat protein
MANAEGLRPSREEVERQLDRLLADEVIASNQNSAKVLKYIVKRALRRRTVTEFDVLKGVFKRVTFDKVDDSTARVTMEKLRGLLTEYYKGDGQYDPVVIALPDPTRKTAAGKRIKFSPGEAYTPSFTYNPSGWIAKELAVAYHLLRGSPAQMEQALTHFSNVGRAQPEHPEVMLGLLEHWAFKLLFGAMGDPHITLVAGPLVYLGKIEKQNGATWRTHNIRGMFHAFMGDRKAAEKAFARALEMNRPATISRGGYVGFLFRTAREEQALRLFALEAEERADNAQVHAVYGIYLTHAHRHEEAERAFSKSLMLDRNCWAAHYGLTQMYQALGNHEKAVEHEQRLEELLEPGELQQMRQALSNKAEGRKR